MLSKGYTSGPFLMSNINFQMTYLVLMKICLGNLKLHKNQNCDYKQNLFHCEKNKYRINDMFCTQKRPPFAGNDVLNDAHQSLLSLSGMFYHQMCTLGCQKNDINIELRHRLSIIYIF